jgi:hypothetical protein
MKFLRTAVDHLLEGIDCETSSAQWTDALDRTFCRSHGTASWNAYTNQAYPSPLIDFHHLVDLARSRLSNAEDHLWLLQTDAAYLQYHARMLTHGRIVKEGPALAYSTFAMEARSEPVNKVKGWRWITEELEHVRTQHIRFRESIHLRDSLPLKFEFATGNLELLLLGQLTQYTAKLARLIITVTGFQDHSLFHAPTPRVVFSRMDTDKNKAPKDMFYSGTLHWWLLELSRGGTQLWAYNPATLFEFLDH